jgi:methylated-DNA-[protein]-cysteine S-methyltransferase
VQKPPGKRDGYGQAMKTIDDYLLRTDSPIGRIELTAGTSRLTSLTIEQNGRLPRDDRPENPNDVLARARDQLAEYFGGDRRLFDLPIAPRGTDFQRAVWKRIGRVRWGQSVSYGQLAAALGRPLAGRAIGRAVAANPLPLIIGCHRVLSSEGRVVGYTGGKGIPTKVWLLQHEGLLLPA